jgi:hypothetical protein
MEEIPLAAHELQLLELGFRQSVIQMERDKVRCAFLSPMWQMAIVDGQIAVWIQASEVGRRVKVEHRGSTLGYGHVGMRERG